MKGKFGIIFDMDGTLWDSAEQVAASWTVVVQREYQKDRVISEQDMQRVMGLTMDKISAALFPELPPQERMLLMGKCCEEENAYLREHGGVLYPSVPETLAVLCKQYPLFIVSNCQSGYIEAFLEHYHFERYFEDIECYGNNGLVKGENIRGVMERNSLEYAVYVGDIQGDYDASVQAGADFIHAAYGFGTVEQNVPRLQKFSELPNLLAEMRCHSY